MKPGEAQGVRDSWLPGFFIGNLRAARRSERLVVQPETTVSLKIGGLAICPRPMDEEEGIRPLPRAWFSAVSGTLVLSGTEIVEQYVESRMFEIGLRLRVS